MVHSIDEEHSSGICLWPFFCCPHRPQGCCWELSQSQAPSPSSLPASHSHTVQPHLPSHVSHEQFCTHEDGTRQRCCSQASSHESSDRHCCWNQAWVSFRIGPNGLTLQCAVEASLERETERRASGCFLHHFIGNGAGSAMFGYLSNQVCTKRRTSVWSTK